MRILMMAIMGFLVLSTVAVQAQSLQNASFERPGDADDRAYGWDRWGQWINRECSWTPVVDGSCLIGYHHWQIESGDSSGLYQDVAGAKEGARYAFKIMANADLAKEDKKGPVSVELRLECTVYGEQVTINSSTYKVEEIATGDQWSPLTVSGTAANDTLRVLVIVYPSPEGPRDGAVKFDAAALREW